MSANLTIQKNTTQGNSSDYFYLRRLGMKYIEELGSKFWTDYNIHDPGITLLEALCYAITDLGYRTSYSVQELIAPAQGEDFDPSKQALFTARDILTVNPWTINDYRKILIDIDGIKNGWVDRKNCPCEDVYLYVDCEKETLTYKPVKSTTPVIVKGLYDVIIEFEDVDGFGDLNSGKLFGKVFFQSKDSMDFGSFAGTLEVRFPAWQQVETQKQKFKNITDTDSSITSISVTSISGNKSDKKDIKDDLLFGELNEPLYFCATIEYLKGKENATPEILALDNIPFKVWLKGTEAKQNIRVADLRMALEDAGPEGLVNSFLSKIKKSAAVINETANKLNQYRNLAEDWCSIKAVAVEDVSVCADVEVTPDADIEQVLATAYFLIGRYFAPDVYFHSLKDLMGSDTPVDEIFDGPALDHGFIKNDELEATKIKTRLYSSDVINLLMDIPGVKAVRNLTIVGFDDEGRKTKAETWIYNVTAGRQPRLYMQANKIMVFKNGLPFLPNIFELSDSLQMLKGLNGQQAYNSDVLDLPVQKGKFRNTDAYYPLQYQLPKTYGVSKAGLVSQAGELRHAQAKQLSGYLLMFEQLFVNYLGQLRNLNKLFSLDETVQQTYFSFLLNENVLGNAASLINADEIALQNIIEDEDTRLDRRNRFLDHLLSRFAENFSDYALMLFSLSENKKLTQQQLIDDKIDFLKSYPEMSHNRGKSFNYKNPDSVCSASNVAGLKIRIEKLLGFKQLNDFFELYEEKDDDHVFYETRWRLKNYDGKIILSGSTRYKNQDFKISKNMARQEIDAVLKAVSIPENYTIVKDKKWTLNLTNGTEEIIATRKHAFKTKAEAQTAKDELVAFAKEKLMAEKIHIVEHVLLRPRNKPSENFLFGDPLLGICTDKNCTPCSEDDPYSHRITIVISGESGLGEEHIAFRRFAENTIRLEVPAHLGVKICWVSTSQMAKFNTVYCSWLAELAKAQPDANELHNKLSELLQVFNHLKSVYPEAFLHDCKDGNDDNRVFLNRTII